MLVARYPTKKALKESIGKALRYSETSIHGPEYKSTGRVSVVGPDAYNRKWYATVQLKDGLISKVS